MEIEYESNNSKCSENIFKLDYKDQSLKSNSLFNAWKNKMLLKYGRDAKLFKCKNENLFFYVPYQEYKNKFFFSGKCPSCNTSLCYFCFKKASRNCCITIRTYYIFFEDTIDSIENDNKKFCIEFLKFLIPISSLFLIIGIFAKIWYYTLQRKDDDKTYFKDKDIYWASILIYGLTAIILSIIFMFFDIYLKIILLFISLFSKCYPIKYYIGFIKAGLDDI